MTVDLVEFVSMAMGGGAPSGNTNVTVTVRLPGFQVDQLDYVAKYLAVSRQVLMARLIDSGLHEVVRIVSEQISDQGGVEVSEFISNFDSFYFDSQGDNQLT